MNISQVNRAIKNAAIKLYADALCGHRSKTEPLLVLKDPEPWELSPEDVGDVEYAVAVSAGAQTAGMEEREISDVYVAVRPVMF